MPRAAYAPQDDITITDISKVCFQRPRGARLDSTMMPWRKLSPRLSYPVLPQAAYDQAGNLLIRLPREDTLRERLKAIVPEMFRKFLSADKAWWVAQRFARQAGQLVKEYFPFCEFTTFHDDTLIDRGELTRNNRRIAQDRADEERRAQAERNRQQREREDREREQARAEQERVREERRRSYQQGRANQGGGTREGFGYGYDQRGNFHAGNPFENGGQYSQDRYSQDRYNRDRQQAPPPRPTNALQDALDLIGVSRTTSFASMETIYRTLVRNNHPDTKPANERDTWNAKMAKINAAWDILKRTYGPEATFRRNR